MTLDSPVVHAPEILDGVWINAPSPPDWRAAGASALLVSFSDFTCINCLRVLPYTRAWQRLYAPGLFCISVHTPEFSFAHDPAWVTQAAARLGVRWPIVTDNKHAHWTAWAVAAWPTLFLVDQAGFIRWEHVGDRGYPDVEIALRRLIQRDPPETDPTGPIGPLLAEDTPGAVCLPVTPELQADEADRPIPRRPIKAGEMGIGSDDLSEEDGYRLDGKWLRKDDGWMLTGDRGAIHLTYSAAEVHAVLAPPQGEMPGDTQTPDAVAEIQLDGSPLPDGFFGRDVFRKAAGTGLRLDMPRLYNLINSPTVERHELRLSFPQSGSTFYAFSFGSCVMPPIPPTSI